MWGRAGRRGRGLAVYVAGEDALDQFFARHPEEFLQPPGRGGDHRPRRAPRSSASTCSAPRTRRRSPRPTPSTSAPTCSTARRALAEAGLLRERATGFVPARADDYPAGARRAALREPRQLRADRRLAPARSSARSRPARAYSTVHEGAIYLHLGRSYIVLELDLARPPRDPRAVQRQLLHADQEREHDLHRAHARDSARPTACALLRRGRLLGDGARLPAQAPAGPHA